MNKHQLLTAPYPKHCGEGPIVSDSGCKVFANSLEDVPIAPGMPRNPFDHFGTIRSTFKQSLFVPKLDDAFRADSVKAQYHFVLTQAIQPLDLKTVCVVVVSIWSGDIPVVG
ncbi:MAG: hypothetical protein E5X44_32650, partial [Mesorhizobium sp.]